MTSIELRNPTESQPVEITHFLFQSASKIENDSFGIATRALVDRVAQQLIQRYGQTKKMDFLVEGSIWTEPQYWMHALEAKERYYAYCWDREMLRNPPDDIENVYLGAFAYNVAGSTTVLEYTSPKMMVVDDEENRRMANLL